MKRIAKKLILTQDKYFETHLWIVNALLPKKNRMTEKEIEILAIFMGFEGQLAQDRFGTTARKFVKESLTLSDGGLGNHLKSLKTKGILGTKNNVILINPLVLCEQEEQEYSFKIERIKVEQND